MFSPFVNISIRITHTSVNFSWFALSHQIYRMIKYFNHTQSCKLSNKSLHPLAESKWKHIGYHEMVVNLTDFQFSTTEIEAFSFGLKFATGIHQNFTTNTILHNYGNCDTNFSRAQGIILGSVSQPNDSFLPKR